MNSVIFTEDTYEQALIELFQSIYNFYKEIEGQNTTFLKEQSFISPKNDTFALELKVLNLHGKFESFESSSRLKPKNREMVS